MYNKNCSTTTMLTRTSTIPLLLYIQDKTNDRKACQAAKIVASLLGINFLLWCGALAYGINQLSMMKQEVEDLSIRCLNQREHSLQKQSEVDSNVSKREIERDEVGEIKMELEDVGKEVQQLQTMYHQFNKFWLSLAAKVI